MSHFPHTWDFFYRPGVLSFLKESFVKAHTKQKMIWKVKISCNKAPNRSQFWLQSSYFLPRFCVTDLRFLALFFEFFFGLVDRFLLLHTCKLISSLARAFGSISLYYSLLEFAVPSSIVSNVVIFIPGWKRHLEKISSMGEMRQMIYLRLIQWCPGNLFFLAWVFGFPWIFFDLCVARP